MLFSVKGATQINFIYIPTVRGYERFGKGFSKILGCFKLIQGKEDILEGFLQNPSSLCFQTKKQRQRQRRSEDNLLGRESSGGGGQAGSIRSDGWVTRTGLTRVKWLARSEEKPWRLWEWSTEDGKAEKREVLMVKLRQEICSLENTRNSQETANECIP